MENSKLMGIIGIIVLMIVGFSFVSAMTGSINKGAKSVSEANNCTTYNDADGYALTYNATSGGCFNSSFGTAYNASLYTAGTYKLPLSSLFASGGVVLLVLMIGVLVFFIRKSVKG